MDNGVQGIQETLEMFSRIDDSGECSYFSIPGNTQEDSGECSTRFGETFQKIPENVIKDFGEYPRGFRGMLLKSPGNGKKNLGNLDFNLFLKILLDFYQILLSNCYKTIETKQLLSNSSKENIFFTATYY